MASISSAASRSGKDTAEYQVVRGHFGPLVKQCQHVLPNLANELFKKDVISKMEYNAIIQMVQSTYGTAVNMMNMVLTKIELNSSSFHLLVECLRVAGLNSIADDLGTALSEDFTFNGGSRLAPKASLSSPVSGSRGENTSEYKIVKDHFSPLVKQCQHVLASFANELFSRELITKMECHNAIDNSQPIYNRVVLMLHSVLTKIENNSSCFHLLVTCLKIAELHSIADDLETALREEKNLRVALNNPEVSFMYIAADLENLDAARGKLAALRELAAEGEATKGKLAAERELAALNRELRVQEAAVRTLKAVLEGNLTAMGLDLGLAAEGEDAKWKLIAALNRILKEKEATMMENEATIMEKEATMREQEATMREQEATISEQVATLVENEATIMEKEATMREQVATMREQVATMREQVATLEGIQTALREDLGHSLSVSSSSPLPLNVVTTSSVGEADIPATKVEIAYETWRTSDSHKSG